MNRAHTAVAAVWIALAAVLVGCGGGGSSNDAAAGPPVVPTSQQPLSLKQDNAFDASAHAFTLGALALALGQSAADLTEIATGGRARQCVVSRRRPRTDADGP
jgi:hypothetical protein